MSTWKQDVRQSWRSADGRYAETYPCNRCGRSAGVDYYSDRRTDCVLANGRRVDDEALCLCKPCADLLDTLDDVAFEAQLDDPRWGKLPRPRKRPAAEAVPA